MRSPLLKSIAFIILRKHDVSGEPRIPAGQKHGGEWTKLKPGEAHPHGHAPSTAEMRATAKERGVVVPPASWGLLVATDPSAKVQATWYDSRGRKQYGYHSKAVEQRNSKKFGALAAFAGRIQGIRKQLRHDLKNKPKHSRDRVGAVIATIIDQTGMRVGSERYAEENGTYGASSLRKEHVTVTGDMVRFTFHGKHSKQHDLTIANKDLANAVRDLMELPGERLMQYVGKDGPEAFSEDKVTAYLGRYRCTAKMWRTFHATRIARDELEALGPAANQRQAKKNVLQAVTKASQFLGNTPAVCKSAYIEPGLIEQYMAQSGE